MASSYRLNCENYYFRKEIEPVRIELKKGSHINLSCGGYCAEFEIDETIGS